MCQNLVLPVLLCSWKTGGGSRKRVLGRVQSWTTLGMKQPSGRTGLVDPRLFTSGHWGQGIEPFFSHSCLSMHACVHCIWSHICIQCGQIRPAWGRLSQYVHLLPLLHVEEEQGEVDKLGQILQKASRLVRGWRMWCMWGDWECQVCAASRRLRWI